MITKQQCSSRYLAVIVAAAECFFYGAILNGWPSLLYLIKQDGIYRYLCINNSTDSESNLTERSSTEEDPRSQEVCFEEEAMYNLALSVGQSLKYLGFLPVAFMIDILGIKPLRLLGCLSVMGGGLMLGFCTKDHPYLLFPGCSLVGISAPLYIMSNLQIANVFHRQKSTVLSILGVSQSAAAMLFLFFKFLSDYVGISWNISFIFWGSSASLTLLPTFLFFPKILSKSSVDETERQNISSGSSDCQKETMGEQTGRIMNGPLKKVNYSSIEIEESKCHGTDTVMKSVLSFPFIIHCYAITIYNINVGVYNGSYSWWLNEVTDDQSVVSSVTNMLGLVVVIKIVLTPLGGMLMDYLYNKYRKENRDVRTAGFFLLLLAGTAHLGLITSTMVNTLTAVRISAILCPLAQATYIVSTFCYTRTRFPKDHYNRIIGIFHLIAGLEPSIQYLLFRLMMSKELLVRTIILVLVGISFLDPFHLLCLRKKNI